MKNYNTLLLAFGIIVLANLLSKQYFFRWDFTEDKQFTLSNATKDILRSLEDPVTITAYFSENLPVDVAKTRRDFQDLLVEYANISKGMVDYEFVDPNEDPQVEQEAQQNGISPVMINVREKDEVKQQKAYLGAIIKLGEQRDVIPFMQPGTAMEYALSTGIKKLSILDKPSVGIIQGSGAAGPNELGQVYQSLSILYNVETINLGTEASIADRFKAVAFVRPTDSIPNSDLAKLDDYLSRGGKLFIAMNAVDGDFSTAQGSQVTTGLEGWLRSKGLIVENSFVVDAKCGSVTVQRRQGFFTMQTPVQFPFLPLVNSFVDHPATKGLEQVIFTFASPLRYEGDSAAVFTPLVTTSAKAGIIQAPTFFDVANKQWTDMDFPMSNLAIGGVLEGNLSGNMPSKIVVITDGDFPISQQGRGQSPEHINLMVNCIDWLSDDTGLIELRTKGIASRPIEDLEDGDRSFYKYLNFFLPLILIIIYGVYRMQVKRNLRIRRMQERYA